MFTSDFFTANRARLRELFTGTAPIVVSGNGRVQRSGDTTYPFQQEANFWYLTGINEPDAVLVMDRSKDYIILPIREGKQAIFDGMTAVEDISKQSGIQTILTEKAGWKELEARLRKVKHVATIAAPPEYIESYGMYTNPARARMIAKVQVLNKEISLLDISEHLVRLRMVKQTAELQAIQQSIDITIASIQDATRTSQRTKYAYEYEIEAELYRGFRTRGAIGHAFEPIVAAGKNATTIHYLANDSALSTEELIVLDVGAEYHHYAADITRTIALKEPSRRQEQVFEAVADVQRYAYSLLKPGVVISQYEQEIEHYMGEKLRELGLIKTIESDSVRTYYPHATSHHLGLNVHDVADYSRPLEPDMVITVEPGIYISEERLGVRIEDDVRITDSGIEVLTSSLPSRLF